MRGWGLDGEAGHWGHDFEGSILYLAPPPTLYHFFLAAMK